MKLKDNQFTVTKHINKEISLGDLVRINDGSGLSLLKNESLEKIYIVRSYPNLTGNEFKIKHLPFKVVQIGIKHIISYPPVISSYQLDIKLEGYGMTLYTCSGFVDKYKEIK